MLVDNCVGCFGLKCDGCPFDMCDDCPLTCGSDVCLSCMGEHPCLVCDDFDSERQVCLSNCACQDKE